MSRFSRCGLDVLRGILPDMQDTRDTNRICLDSIENQMFARSHAAHIRRDVLADAPEVRMTGNALERLEQGVDVHVRLIRAPSLQGVIGDLVKIALCRVGEDKASHGRAGYGPSLPHA